jgi:hypothetical protein
VIGTAVEGLPGVLGDGRGVLVAPENAAALAEAIDGVLSGALRTDLHAARRYARGFSPQTVAARYAAAYRDLCATSGDGAGAPPQRARREGFATAKDTACQGVATPDGHVEASVV